MNREWGIILLIQKLTESFFSITYICRKDPTKKQGRINFYNNELGVNIDTDKFNKLILRNYVLHEKELKTFAQNSEKGDTLKYNILNGLEGDTYD